MENDEENKSKKNLPNKVGKDGRAIYYTGENTPYWGTGAIKCRALVLYCKGSIYDEEGKQIGVCNYVFGANQEETVCPQCGATRKICNRPALKETQEWEVPVCRSHAVGISQYFNKLGIAIKDEEQVKTLQELMDTDLVPAIEVLKAYVANVALKQIGNQTPDWKVIKTIESFYGVLEKDKKIKENKTEGLEEAVRQKVMREAEPIQIEGAVAGIIHTYRGLPKDIKIERFKELRKDSPIIAQKVVLKSGDPDLIEFISSVEGIYESNVDEDDKE